MAHFNFVISQNAKWGHAGFYIDCHRMTVPENILLQKKHWSWGRCSTGAKLTRIAAGKSSPSIPSVDKFIIEDKH